MQQHPIPNSAKPLKICKRCQYESPSHATRCPRCGQTLLSKHTHQVIGTGFIVIGLGMLGLSSMLVLGVARALLETSQTIGIAGVLVLGFFVSFGVWTVIEGFYHFRYSRGTKLGYRIALILYAVLMVVPLLRWIYFLLYQFDLL
jgi:ribosomal protein L40E